MANAFELCGTTYSWTPDVFEDHRKAQVRLLVLSVSWCLCAGDILGRALKNLDGLLQMPYGCGEQNMVLLAPNIYILQYLEDTKQLTTTIKEKATDFLISGELVFFLFLQKEMNSYFVEPATSKTM